MSGMSDGELPRAVASGIELAPGADDVYVPVEPRRVALGVGVLAALYLVALYCAAPVPGRALALFGVPRDQLGRDGGMRMTWRPPGDLDPRELRRLDIFESAADGYIVDVPGVAAEDVEATAHRMGGEGRLEFHVVLEVPEMQQLAGVLGLPMHGQQPIDVEVDQWRPEDGGPMHTDYFLRGPTREALMAQVAKARDLGWKLPAGARIAFAHESFRADKPEYWRTYVIADEPALDGTAIDNATGSYDPNTNRPIVLLDFTREGAETFGDLTARIVGHKLATMLDDEVKSAPIINGPIRGGRASIAMGGGDLRAQERERDELLHVLGAGELPRGGRVLSATYVEPGETPVKRWLARFALGLVGGALAGGLAWLAVRVLRPHRRRVRPLAGTQSVALPMFWTFMALLGMAAGLSLMLPGINETELENVLNQQGHWFAGSTLSIFALGIVPVVSSAVVVEMAVWIVPRWRRVRDGGAEARRKIGLAVGICTVVLATVQAYFLAQYMDVFNRGGAEVFVAHGAGIKWLIMVTLVAGVMCMAWLASVITRRGLGNGYAVMLAASWILHTIDRLSDVGGAKVVLVVVTIACVAAVVLVTAHWRVRGPRSVAMPLPAAGMIPLAGAGGLVVAISLLTSLGLPLLPERLADVLHPFEYETVALVALVVATALWSWALARPGRRAKELDRAGLVPANGEMWLRAAAASALVLLAIYFVTHATSSVEPALGKQIEPRLALLVEPVSLVLAIAVIADLFTEWRDRRRGLVAVRQLHDPLLADVVRDRLAAAGIDHHMQSLRARTLLAAFASYVPITVLVAADRADDAERELRELLE
jgi:hypothetical protein